MAWVDEGPGPPLCPECCGTLKEQSNYENQFNLNVVNSPSMDNNSTISGDSHTLNRDSRKQTNKRGRGDMCDDIRNRHPVSQGGSYPFSFPVANTGRTAQSTTTSATKAIHVQQQSQREGAVNGEQQQKEKTTIPCLDCLGDSTSTRPARICSSGNIKLELQRLRLRHCCERDLYSALHGNALAEVLRGGRMCEEHLTSLMETDRLATRITCEFTEILVRYDCRQMYSIIHHCEDCKVSSKSLKSMPHLDLQ